MFAPVSRAVWEHALSGYRPVQAWVTGRLHRRVGRRSSRLDAIVDVWSAETSAGLLALLWAVEGTLARPASPAGETSVGTTGLSTGMFCGGAIASCGRPRAVGARAKDSREAADPLGAGRRAA